MNTLISNDVILLRPMTMLIALILAASALPAAAQAAQCEGSALKEAQALKEARKTRDAIRVMKKGLSACEDFTWWQYLGKLYEDTRAYPDAKKAYTKAKKMAESPEQQAAAIAGYGSVLLSSGRRAEALPVLQSALQQYESPPQWLIEKTRQLDLAMNDPAAQDQLITRGFSNQAFSTLAINRSINIRLNFLTNSVELDAPSKARIPTLIEELSGDKYEGKTIWLIGHSDSRGSADMNMKLSWARAEAIQKQLAETSAKLKQRVKINGKGEQEPLYPGMDDSDYMLNRRLQLIIE